MGIPKPEIILIICSPFIFISYDDVILSAGNVSVSPETKQKISATPHKSRTEKGDCIFTGMKVKNCFDARENTVRTDDSKANSVFSVRSYIAYGMLLLSLIGINATSFDGPICPCRRNFYTSRSRPCRSFCFEAFFLSIFKPTFIADVLARSFPITPLKAYRLPPLLPLKRLFCCFFPGMYKKSYYKRKD